MTTKKSIGIHHAVQDFRVSEIHILALPLSSSISSSKLSKFSNAGLISLACTVLLYFNMMLT